MTAVSKKIVIVGGGIGGLAAALSLLKRGHDVEVYEQASELKEVGAGIQISSNGTRVLHALGLEDGLKRVQVLPSRRVIRHWSTGETWNWFDLGATTAQRYGTPHVMLHRGDLQGLLADALRAQKPDAVKLGLRCAAISADGDYAEVYFEDGASVRAAYVIGADGIHSRSAPVCLAPTALSSLVASLGVASWRWTSCRRICRRCWAPTGSDHAAMCCTIRCGAARS